MISFSARGDVAGIVWESPPVRLDFERDFTENTRLIGRDLTLARYGI